MRAPLLRLTSAAAVALLLAGAGTAQAQSKGKEKHLDGARKHAQLRQRHDDGDYRERSRDPRYDRETRRDERHGGYGRAGTPPGLAKKGGIPPGLAKKPGGMPPGQYKHLYTTREGASVLRDVLVRHGYHVVHTSDAGNAEYLDYRAPNGTVRRAVVSEGVDQLRFSQVPSALLREVQARLH